MGNRRPFKQRVQNAGTGRRQIQGIAPGLKFGIHFSNLLHRSQFLENTNTLGEHLYRK